MNRERWTEVLLLCFFSLCLGAGCVMVMTSRASQQPDRPSIVLTEGFPIEGIGLSSFEQISAFIRNRNPSLDDEYLSSVVRYYISESRTEHISHDVAIAQMCLETNFLAFTGKVSRLQNNFAGIGAVSSTEHGYFFLDIQEGVRVHIQHLVAYATKRTPVNPVIDPRFGLVERGVAPRVEDLSLRWATDPEYGSKIISLISRLLNT